MKKLYHNQKVIINNRRGRVFTVSGYAKEYNENPMDVIIRTIQNGHMLYCISQEPSIMTGDRELNVLRNKEWESATRLEDDEIVEIEGNALRVIYQGNYSDMAHLTLVNRRYTEND